MSIRNQLLLTIIVSGFAGYLLRGMIYQIEAVNLSHKAIKVRKKGQSFKEWLFVSRFMDVIPKWVLIFYWVVVDCHLILVCTVFIACIVPLIQAHSLIVLKIVLCFDFIWILIVGFMTWELQGGICSRFDRIIPKVKKKDRNRIR